MLTVSCLLVPFSLLFVVETSRFATKSGLKFTYIEPEPPAPAPDTTYAGYRASSAVDLQAKRFDLNAYKSYTYGLGLRFGWPGFEFQSKDFSRFLVHHGADTEEATQLLSEINSMLKATTSFLIPIRKQNRKGKTIAQKFTDALHQEGKLTDYEVVFYTWMFDSKKVPCGSDSGNCEHQDWDHHLLVRPLIPDSQPVPFLERTDNYDRFCCCRPEIKAASCKHAHHAADKGKCCKFKYGSPRRKCKHSFWARSKEEVADTMCPVTRWSDVPGPPNLAGQPCGPYAGRNCVKSPA